MAAPIFQALYFSESKKVSEVSRVLVALLLANKGAHRKRLHRYYVIESKWAENEKHKSGLQELKAFWMTDCTGIIG